MEKNKRKFFIGKFPGKQGRKWEQERLLETNAREIHRGTNARKAKRALGVLLAAALVFQTLPFGSAAASASEGRGGLCEHHRSHTPDCGYREAEPGAECTHEHTEDCYKTVEDCIHEHTESCYPADTVSESEGAPADVGERQPTECSHSCSEESGCITKELDCRHEHDGSCGYTEGMPGSPCTFVCEICNGGTPEDDGNDSETGGETKEPDQEAEEKPDDGQEECICEKPCKEDSINQECPVCGAEDADLSECKGKDAEEDTQKPEDTGICKHHQAHDESCGYQPASEDGEGSPCTYDCRICPIEELIAALPEVGSITEENGSEVRAQLDQILALFAELTGEEQEQLDLSRCYELQEALDGANAPDPAAEEDGPAQIKMEVKGVTTYLTGDQLKEALGANQNKGATFTLLDDVKLPDGVSLFTHAGGDITLDCGSYTLSGNCESSALVYVNRDSLTLKGGTLKNTDPTGCCVAVSSKFGQFRMEGGTLLPEGGSGHAIEVYGSVTVTGGSVGESGKGLNLYSSGTATLSGGTFGDIHAENGLSSILAEGYAFCRDGKPVALTLDQKDIEGPVAVVKCTHPDTTAPQDKGDGTHSLSACLACGKSDGAEAHDWTENRLTCTVCGAAAVARMEPDGTLLTEAQLEATLNTVNGIYTLTLLRDLERSERLVVGQYVTCTLDLNGHTIRMTGSGMAIYTYGDSNVTIRGTGEIISVNSNALTVLGTATLEGGTYSGGTAAIAIASQSSSLTLGDLLGHSGDTRYAYFDESGAPLTGVLGDQSLTGTVTVRECQHTGDGVCEYTHAKGTTTHQQTCLACGKVETEENCSYTDGKCACGSTLSVALTNTEKLVYNGKSHEPGVTVTLDGTKLTAAGYDVTYADNVDAGTDTATVTVTGKGNYSFEIEKTFSIEKAEQKDFAVVEKTTQYEKNGTLTLSTTGGGGDGAVLYRVPENNGVLMVNGDQATIIGVGTVTVTATKAESGNYKAATATGIIIITKAPAPAITYPTAADSITYGQKLSDCALTGGSTEYGTFAWENGSMIPTVDNTGYTVVFTASKETEKNYETITDTTQNVPVKVKQAVPAVSVTAAVSGSKDNRQAVITVNVAKAGAGAFPTGTVTFIDCTGSTEVTIGTATLSNGSASYTWDGLQDKTYTIKAVYKGNNNYTEAESRETAFDAAKQNQQDFALDAIGAKTYGDAAITLKTTGGSGSGAVRYESSDENVIRIEDGRAVIVGAGTATITAIKEGDNNYNEASASRNVTVAKKALTVRADSKTVVRGNPMPAFTYRTDGLVNGDTFTKAPAITAGAQDTDTLGKYDIVINGGTLRNSESYSITYVNGTLNIVERFYTVTVTDGTGGGEYAQGDTVTVTANEKNGYTFTGWSSGDGVAFADSKAKTTTFTMPTKSVTVKANYTRNSSGGNNGGGSGDGGNSGGSGNNSGGNSGDNRNNGGGGSTNPGNGSTTPQIPVIPPAENINPGNEATPGTGTTPVNPGNGNTSRPGTTPGSGTGTPAQGTKQPFIKGGDGRTGWDVIRAEEEQAQEGSTINVDMNGSVVVPGDIFDSIKGKDITITFDMGNGIIWSVDGKSITADKAGDIDFSVKTGVKTVPVDIVNNVTGENYSIQISLAHEGEFGFTAVLSIGLGRENAGYTASLYYYNENTGELEFICKDQIAEDGTVSLVFTHASDYVIAVDIESMDGKEGVDNTPETSRTGDDSIIADVKENDEVAWIYKLVIIAVGTIVIVAGFGIIFIWKKKKEEQ